MLVCFDGDGIHGNHTRKCETCQVSDSTIYCLTHSSYLCTSCDEHIHAANSIASRHERLWICTICENAPATCVDALSLCTNCDAQIHSLNLLACHHQPIPTTPVSTFFYCSAASNRYHPTVQEAHEDETDSWLFLDPDKNKNQDYNDFSHSRMSDEYLDIVEHTSCTEYQHNDNQPYSFHRGNNGGDTAVHVQNMEANKHENSKATLNCTISSNQNVTAFFVDNGIVPEATMSDVSKPYATPPKERIDSFPSITPVNTLQFTRMDREEKVLRYREKKKARKFEKKIRYASRKASAEIRPRVRGRFARRIDIEVE